MIHPATELRFVNDRIGYGVFASRDIPRGTITWAGDALDQSFTGEQIAAMEPPYQEIVVKYSFLNPDASYVLCWDISRFVNHSCEPSCLAPGYDFEIAVRDIERGEELTDDYGSLNIEADFECHCGSGRCRRVIHPDDLLGHAEEWDELVAGAFSLIRSVEQPLWYFVREKQQVEQLLDARQRPPSCRLNYCPQAARSRGVLGR